MSFCLNPACPKPDNPDTNKFCQGCGSKLAESTNSYNFEHYRVIKLLGEGGFGRTYLAEDLELFNKKVVIKKLIAIDANNPKILELFSREAEQLYQLSHPQIPKLHRYFNKDNNFYLIQEFIPGENLLGEFELNGSFSEPKIIEILQKILLVLEYIQSKDVIHRDIKPENIMRCCSDNQLMLIDFGAVRVKTNTDPSMLTSIYTPGYASREQINGRAVKASDVYSLGVTCIRLLTGCLPKGTTDFIYDDFENKWTWKEYLKQKNISIDPLLAKILDKMVEDSLKRRYQDAREVRQDLASLKSISNNVPLTVINSVTGTHQPETIPPTVLNNISKPANSTPNLVKWFAMGGVGVVLVGGLVVATLIMNNSPGGYSPSQSERTQPSTTAETHHNNGNKYYEQGQYQLAIEEHNQAIALDPNYIDAYINRGLAYSQLGDYNQAIADYSKAIELNSSYTDAYNNRGVAYYNLQQYTNAIADYNKVIELNPNDNLTYNNRGLAYASLQMFYDAVIDYSKAIELNPDYADTYNNRGVAYYNLGEYQKAIADYEQTLKLKPNHPLARTNLENLRQELGR